MTRFRVRHASRALRTLAVLAALIAEIVTAIPAMGHAGGLPTVIIPLDHVVPDESFEILLSDFAANSAIHITLVQDGKTIVLAEATTGADGHGSASATLPATFALGYVQLFAMSDDGATADTWIRVGTGTYTSPGSTAKSDWWTDPSILVFGVFILGAVAALTFLATRSRRPRPG